MIPKTPRPLGLGLSVGSGFFFWGDFFPKTINQFEALQDKLGFLIEKSKNNYYPNLFQKLSDKTTSHKTHWSILKTFINDKKISCIPSVCHDNKFVTDFREKAELFRICFAEQCSLSTKNSELPNNLSFLTEKRLSNVLISNDTVMKILNNPNSINFHDHDMKMLKL